MAVSVATICLGSGAKLAPAELQCDLRAKWPDLPPVTKPEKAAHDKTTIVFNVGKTIVTITVVATPVPWSELKFPCENSVLWPEAADQVRQHKGHLVVSVVGDLQPIPLVSLLTKVTGAIVGTASGVVGVYWKNANMVLPPELFRQFAVEVLPEGPPMPIWVDTCVGINSEGYTCGFTTGMKSLGFMEIETLSSSDLPKDLRQRFHGLAYYLVENGPVIHDGDTLGETEAEQVRVAFSDSGFGRPETVMRLDYLSMIKEKKGWFR